jgi:transcription initiation factor TFIID subunit 1
MRPVNKKAVKDYYEIIKQPMDLETMTAKIKGRKYHSREEFLHDMELIYRNSLQFNGETNEFTLKVSYLSFYQIYCRF